VGEEGQFTVDNWPAFAPPKRHSQDSGLRSSPPVPPLRASRGEGRRTDYIAASLRTSPQPCVPSGYPCGNLPPADIRKSSEVVARQLAATLAILRVCDRWWARATLPRI